MHIVFDSFECTTVVCKLGHVVMTFNTLQVSLSRQSFPPKIESVLYCPNIGAKIARVYYALLSFLSSFSILLFEQDSKVSTLVLNLNLRNLREPINVSNIFSVCKLFVH